VNGYVNAVVEASGGPEDDIRQLRQQRTKLALARIEGYYVDLRRSVRVYFLSDAEPMEVVCPKVDATVARNFDTALVAAAIGEFRSGRCTYSEFCATVITAGCTGYFISILDRRAEYFGRAGPALMEQLPDDYNDPG
jgi:hypothetical protein